MGRTTSSPSSPDGEGGFGSARRVQFVAGAARGASICSPWEFHTTHFDGISLAPTIYNLDLSFSGAEKPKKSPLSRTAPPDFGTPRYCLVRAKKQPYISKRGLEQHNTVTQGRWGSVRTSWSLQGRRAARLTSAIARSDHHSSGDNG